MAADSEDTTTAADAFFSALTDDIVLAIFSKLDDDPRHRPILSSVCTRFSSLLRHHRTLLPSHLLPLADESSLLKLHFCCPGLLHAGIVVPSGAPSSDDGVSESGDPIGKRRKLCNPNSHLASGAWNLSREQGGKLLSRQFRDDCLYLCDWPGCVHLGEKRNYRIFRGFLRDFKGTRVWRAISDGDEKMKKKKKKKVDVGGCAFCRCEETWDLHSAFCLRRGFGYHDDGEPVVRAFVCENGHVSGAWTDLPLYS